MCNYRNMWHIVLKSHNELRMYVMAANSVFPHWWALQFQLQCWIAGNRTINTNCCRESEPRAMKLTVHFLLAQVKWNKVIAFRNKDEVEIITSDKRKQNLTHYWNFIVCVLSLRMWMFKENIAEALQSVFNNILF